MVGSNDSGLLTAAPPSGAREHASAQVIDVSGLDACEEVDGLSRGVRCAWAGFDAAARER
jgi:hypothetical protein